MTLSLAIVVPTFLSMHGHERQAAVAGRFYPEDARVLARDVDRYLAEGVPSARSAPPKALIVPHAGFVYSGPIAGSAYRALGEAGRHVRRVVLLGPAHRVALRGLARPEANAFATPLGPMRVDERLDALLPFVPKSDLAHAGEHSLEVQLPFLRRVLHEDATIAPLVVGNASPEEVARAIDALWGGDETLIVVSSDLSHYLPYEAGRRIDDATADDIVALDAHIEPERACGARAIDGLLLVAARRGLEAVRLDVRSSGDTAGGRDEVVGYGAFAFYAPRDVETRGPSEAERGRALLALARAAVEEALGVPGAHASAPERDPAWMRERGAVFVTLRRGDGSLHGCIGGLEAERPLGVAVRRAGAMAATEDPRAREIRPEVAADLTVEVSCLGPMERLAVTTREDLLSVLRPGQDGLVLSWRGRRATFLPQVWESISDRAQFVDELWRKAGLPRGFWADDVEAFRYRVRKYVEPERAT